MNKTSFKKRWAGCECEKNIDLEHWLIKNRLSKKTCHSLKLKEKKGLKDEIT